MQELPPVNDSSQGPENGLPPDEQQVHREERLQNVGEGLVQGVAQDIQALFHEMSTLRRDFQTKVQYDESKERIIENLHRELQENREGLHFRILLPILNDLIGLYDDMGKLIDSATRGIDSFSAQMMHHFLLFQIGIYDEAYRLIETLPQNNGSSSTQSIQHIILFQESIEEILHRHDVDSFTLDGDFFVAGRQRILRTIPTDNAQLDKCIARRVRKGFACGQRLLRPELIDVYKYTPEIPR